MSPEATLTDRNAVAIQRAAEEIGRSVVAIRQSITETKHLLDGEDADPERLAENLTLLINREQRLISVVIGRQTKSVAQALADRYGMDYLKKHTSVQISTRLAAHIVNEITADSEEHDAVVQAARGVRRRADGIEMADRVLRYWASLPGDMADVWRWWRPESVLMGCQYYGHVYLHCRGEESQSHSTPLDPPLEIEQALRRTGNVALNHLLTGHGRGNTENMIMQMRVGELEGYLLMEIASRTIVMLTHGYIDVNERGDDGIMVPAEHMLPTSLAPHEVQWGA